MVSVGDQPADIVPQISLASVQEPVVSFYLLGSVVELVTHRTGSAHKNVLFTLRSKLKKKKKLLIVNDWAAFIFTS